MFAATLPVFAAATLALAAVTAGSTAATSTAVQRPQAAAAVLPACAPRAPTPPGLDFSCPRPDGSTCQPLEFRNFAGRDLRHANFQGATLVGVTFIHARLQGANFKNATFMPGGMPLVAPTDFTAANLDNACFIGATFKGNTYFTAANLSAADFSGQDFTASRAIFGDQRLRIDDTQRRPLFRGAHMNCEFVDQWAAFDLTGADVSQCATQLAGRDYSNARMARVNFASTVLDGTLFVGADLSGAVLDGASLQCGPPTGGGTARCVDLSNAKLQGASLNRANLSGASLYGAFLSNNINSSISDAASLRQAHLKNVNLSAAQLSGVDFTLANFYGDAPANPGGCATTLGNFAGFTNGCASAHNANLAAATFSNAYLYGVDFTAAAISGANFDQAVLSGANFAGANVATFAPSGSRTKFTRAHLEGTNLDQAATLDADLTDAFVDFLRGGNQFYVLLNGANHNRFACSNTSPCTPPTGQDVCVWVSYPQTTVPGASTSLTCPDGGPAGAAGCGGGGAANGRWKSSLVAATPPDPGPPPAWYSSAPTYGVATTDPQVLCRGGKGILFW